MGDLPEDKATELGSQLAAELILLSVASTFALNEFVKHRRREMLDEEEYQADVLERHSTLDRLGQITTNNERVIRDLSNVIASVQNAK